MKCSYLDDAAGTRTGDDRSAKIRKALAHLWRSVTLAKPVPVGAVHNGYEVFRFAGAGCGG